MTATENRIPEPWIDDDRTTIDSYTCLRGGARIHNGVTLIRSSIGRWTEVGPRTLVHHGDVGSFCSIAWGCSLGATQHPLDHATTHEFPLEPSLGFYDGVTWREGHERTRIGHDVWIGCHATIMPGVTVNNGSIIGAGAVVTKDVMSYAVMAGVPARLIRRRFDERTAKRLDEIEWWTWPESKLRSCVALFQRPLSEGILRDLENLA